MNFIELILTAISNFGTYIGDLFSSFIEFLAKPLSYLLDFLVGVFYFIEQLFFVLVEFIKLFGALFQFLFAIATGLIRTISSWVGFTPSASYNMPSTSMQGFEYVLSTVVGTGLVNVIPMILIAILWILFAVKIIGLFGGKGEMS